MKHISKVLYYSKPLLLWLGNGYHIIIPVNATKALKHFEDFKGLSDRPSNEFLQFAKSYLSFNIADKANNLAFKSFLRDPYTLNSKCFVDGIDPKGKIIQEFDDSKPLSKIDNPIGEFMTFL